MALPEDTAGKAKAWAEKEGEREKEREAFMGRLQSVEKDPITTLGAMV